MLSKEQLYAFEKFKQGQNIFLSGAAGCGKSYLIKLMYEYYEHIPSYLQITSTTGCSAVLLSTMIGKPCVKTIHVWSGIRMLKGTIDEIVQKLLSNKIWIKNWKKNVHCLVIDEVSMLSAKMMTILEKVARYTKNPHLPFGGLQVIFVGDMYQLSPVQDGQDIESGRYCFESPCWKDVFPITSCIELTQIYRQSDPLFRTILNEVRIGKLSEESSMILKSYVGRTYDSIQRPMKIVPTRAQVHAINHIEYEKVIGEEIMFRWNIQTNYVMKHVSSYDDSFWKKQSRTTQEYILSTLQQNIPVEEIITLKIGVPVMCLVNINIEAGISNGSMGIIEDMFVVSHDIKIPIVRFTNDVLLPIHPYTWQDIDYPNVAITQLPLCLSYSSTIHKLQGSTLDMAEMNLGNSIFAEGQCYVGLSRVKSLQGLYLTAFHPQKIKVNEKVSHFYQQISEISEMSKIRSIGDQEQEQEQEQEKEQDTQEIPTKEVKEIRMSFGSIDFQVETKEEGGRGEDNIRTSTNISETNGSTSDVRKTNLEDHHQMDSHSIKRICLDKNVWQRMDERRKEKRWLDHR
jgi:ATP-dependent DNA helicase PIF1